MYIEHKTAAAGIGRNAVLDGDDGRTFTVVAAVTGLVDEVKDIILPGAFGRSLRERTPKVIADHDWGKRLGRFTSIKELLPGDPGLPDRLPNGKAWPAQAGALIGTVRLFDSVEGRQAAARWREEGTQQQFSIGYVARKASKRPSDKVRLIADLDCVEVSDVLWGAMPLCGVLPTALATKMLPFATKDADTDGEPAVDVDGDPDLETAEAFEAALYRMAQPEIDWDEVDAASAVIADNAPGATKALDVAALAVAPGYAVEVKRAVPTDERRALAKRGHAMPDGSFPIANERDLRNAIAAIGRAKDPAAARRHVMKRARALDRWDLIPDSWKQQTKSPLWLDDVEGKAGGADRNRGNAERLRRYWTRGPGAAKIRWGTPGDHMRCVRQLSKHMPTERAHGYCNLRHQEVVGAPPGKGHKTWAEHFGLVPAPLALQVKADAEAAEDAPEPHPGVMVALYPPADLAASLAVDGGTTPENLHVTLAYLGNIDETGEDGERLGELRGRIERAVKVAVGGAGPLAGTLGGLGRFPDDGDGAPVWVPVDVPGLSALRERIVGALRVAGLPVRDDHGFTPHLTLGYDLPDVEAPVEATTVRFDRVHVVIGDTRTEVPLSGPSTARADRYDPTIEVDADTDWQVKDYPRLPGSHEERDAALRRALADRLTPEAVAAEEGAALRRPHLRVDGTWDDHVIATVVTWRDTGDDDAETWRVPYSWGPGGEVILGEATPVTLAVTAVPEANAADAPTVVITDATVAVKSLLLAQPETKAGRVLSANNATRLRQATEHLLAVLAAAGVYVTAPEEPGEAGPDAETSGAQARHEDTTAPSVRGGGKAEGKVLIAPDDPMHPANIARRYAAATR